MPLPSLPEMTDIEVHHLCEEFLFREAELLDDNDTLAWLSLLSPELEYVVPVRSYEEARHGEEPVLSNGAYLHETYSSISMRVERLATGRAWAQRPPARTCRLITNICVSGRPGADLRVRSNFMLYRSQPGGPGHELLCGQRRDLLVVGDRGLCLRERIVLLAHTVIPTPNLGIFF